MKKYRIYDQSKKQDDKFIGNIKTDCDIVAGEFVEHNNNLYSVESVIVCDNNIVKLSVKKA